MSSSSWSLADIYVIVVHTIELRAELLHHIVHQTGLALECKPGWMDSTSASVCGISPLTSIASHHSLSSSVQFCSLCVLQALRRRLSQKGAAMCNFELHAQHDKKRVKIHTCFVFPR